MTPFFIFQERRVKDKVLGDFNHEMMTFKTNEELAGISYFSSKMVFFKNGIFQKMAFSKKWHFPKMAFNKKWHFPKNGIFQKMVFFKKWYFPYSSLKNYLIIFSFLRLNFFQPLFNFQLYFLFYFTFLGGTGARPKKKSKEVPPPIDPSLSKELLQAQLPELRAKMEKNCREFKVSYKDLVESERKRMVSKIFSLFEVWSRRKRIYRFG